MNLSKDVKISQVLGHVAAGIAAQTSVVVDMQGFAGVVFVAALGTVTAAAVVTLKAQEDVVNPMTAAKDLSGASASFTAGAADSNKCIVLDVYRPNKRYLQAVLTPTIQNAEIGAIIAIQYQSGAKPTEIDPSVIASALAISPDEV
ncbi:hypothetical protein DEAC_c40180 [Desulfosporosinus acididurans]|uniref:Uncharacterized protein n=1 Tax=Desulfosporosinus acididurans TaxID=476652 RepID=A0A0J1FKN0_9FIRM|nr:hypothetical protein [Desulfosporosinus acididurans]KLU64024.1 hypothetical protein DEAC_c40180 [Desulfosporosinus acididurans]